jgi:hypothetical protein
MRTEAVRATATSHKHTPTATAGHATHSTVTTAAHDTHIVRHVSATSTARSTLASQAPACVTASTHSPTSDSSDAERRRRPRHPSPPHTDVRRRPRGHTATPPRAWHTSRRTTRTRAPPPSHIVRCQRHDCAATHRIPDQHSRDTASNEHRCTRCDSKRAIRDKRSMASEPHTIAEIHIGRTSSKIISGQYMGHTSVTPCLLPDRCSSHQPVHDAGSQQQLPFHTHSHLCPYHRYSDIW